MPKGLIIAGSAVTVAAISIAFVRTVDDSASPQAEAIAEESSEDERVISDDRTDVPLRPAHPRQKDQEAYPVLPDTALFSGIEVTPRLEEAVSRILEELPAIRYRVVEVNSDLIRQAIANVRAQSSATLSIPLFDDVELQSTAFQAINYASGPRVGMSTWLGPLEGAQGSLAVHVDVDGAIRANANAGGHWYQIVALANEPGAHVIVEVDRGALANVRLDAS